MEINMIEFSRAQDRMDRQPAAISFEESMGVQTIGAVRKLSDGCLQQLLELPLERVKYSTVDKIHEPDVKTWMQKMRDGEVIPPPSLRRVNGDIEDFDCRIEAAKRLGLEKITVWLEF